MTGTYTGFGSFNIEEDGRVWDLFRAAKTVMEDKFPYPLMQNITLLDCDPEKGRERDREITVTWQTDLTDSDDRNFADTLESDLSWAVSGLGDFHVHEFALERR